MKGMRCILDIHTDYLISSSGQAAATGLSGLYDGVISHDPVPRRVGNCYPDAKDFWPKAKPLIQQTQAKLLRESSPC